MKDHLQLSLPRFASAIVVSVVLIGWQWIGVAGAQMSAEEWATPWAEKVGVSLEKSFDSSGPDAWDPEEHPLVFITTEGPGYGGLMSGVELPGLAIIDADTREVVAHRNYDVLSWGWPNVWEPHGLGVSPDGQWIYLPTGQGSFLTTGDAGRFLVINARTLKIEKVLKLRGQAHHANSFRMPDGEQRVILYGWTQPLFVLDPDDDNRVVGSLDHSELGIEGYLYFASPEGDEIIAGGGYRGLDLKAALKDNTLIRINTKTWKVKGYVPIEDSSPVWVAFGSDGKYAYITGSGSSHVFKYDRQQRKIVTKARAGVEGPYGVHLGWDDDRLYTIGKGEGSHNRGKVLGMLSSKLMDINVRPMDQFVTNCIRGDHGLLHPDPDANELWITCNSSFEVVIFDLDLKEVSARIPMPNGGSTHSGAFVKYNGWNGEVVSDHNGLQGTALALKRKLLADE